MKHMKKLLAIVLVLCMVFTLTCTAFAEDSKDMEGKIVILHSNDVHGALEGYAKIAGLRDEYEARGAEVIMVDAGDYSQGTPYVSVSKGATAIEMMNAAGYDLATLGNHEFDFGYEQLKSNLENANFKVLCSDVFKDGSTAFEGNAIIEKNGVKIGFFGLETPETYTKVNPALMLGVTFPQGDDLYANAQEQIDKLKADGADVIICLSHLGVDAESEPNRSYDVFNHTTGIDYMIDAHSHTVMTAGENNEPIQSTGTKFANVGVIVIDSETKQVVENKLVAAADITDNEEVLAKAKEIEAEVDAQYGAPFAKSEVELNGDKAPGNRNMETNMGDLITDSMVWSVLNGGKIAVPDDHVVAITNGGGIRAWIHEGDVTMKDVNTVLPFGNTIAVVYVKGSELLEALEASTYSTPGAVGGFPQIAGMKITIDIGQLFDQGDLYPESTYHRPDSIVRVTINEVNGKPFDENATYAVVTNNFCAAGGDTYYAFKAASDQFDTSIPLDEALMQYIKENLHSVIGEQYAEPQGRIQIVGTQEEHDLREQIRDIAEALPSNEALTGDSAKAIDDALDKGEKAQNADELKAALEALKKAASDLEFKSNDFDDVPDDAWYTPAVNYVEAAGLMNGIAPNTFDPAGKMTRAMVVTVLYRMAGEPSVEGKTCDFTDLKQDWYKNAVIWAASEGITNGKTATTFCPDDPVTREQMATFISRYMFADGEENMTEEIRSYLATVYQDASAISDYAVNAVSNCTVNDIMRGDKAAEGALANFRPKDTMTRAECAQVLYNIFRVGLNNMFPAAE